MTHMTPSLSKSLLNNYRQCPRRLWLELRDRRAVREGGASLAQAQYSADTLKRFAEGHVVGRIAQAMWPEGVNIEQDSTVPDEANGQLRRNLRYAQHLTHAWLHAGGSPLFEATFEHDGLLVQADVMVPVPGGWQMIEVKSSSQPKAYHLADLATQAWVARQAGVPLKRVGLLLVNKDFELQQPGNYTGYLQLHDDEDLQDEVAVHRYAMPFTLENARKVASSKKEPTKHQPGAQCADPYECPYTGHCTGAAKPQGSDAVPIRFYKDIGQAKARQLLDAGHTDLRRVPQALIHQLWNGQSEAHTVNRHLAQAVRTGQPVLDREGVRQALARYTWPVQHLDFETISFTAPVWPGTRSGQHIPFQYSVHVQAQNGQVLAHHEFLDTSGQDPRRALAETLVQDLSPASTILAWNASFERNVIRELAAQFADLAQALMRLHAQIEDLLPVVRQHYAHPAMAQAEGSMFSIKTVLPLLVPGMGYDQLDGVQNGGDAQASYLRVAAPQALRQAQGYSDAERQRETENMLRYCKLDTEGMTAILVRLQTLMTMAMNHPVQPHIAKPDMPWPWPDAMVQTEAAAPRPLVHAQPVPIWFLGDKGNDKADALIRQGHTDLRLVPQQRIEQLWNGDSPFHRVNRGLALAARTGLPVLDTAAIAPALGAYLWPVQLLGFCSISLPQPLWPSTRTGQSVPFQYSLKVQARTGEVLEQHAFLDTTGRDPRRALAEQLLADLNPNGTIVGWDALQLRRVMGDLARAFEDLAPSLLTLQPRIRALPKLNIWNCFHPHLTALMQDGAFDPKTVLALLAPDMGVEQLDRLENGWDAQTIYLRVAAPQALRQAQGYSDAERQRETDNMLRYCKLDTEGMTAILALMLKRI